MAPSRHLEGANSLRRIFLMLGAAIASSALPISPQENEVDLSSFSIEELMEIELVTVSVLGSHTHLKGEWMVGYKYMLMSMDGNLDGTQRMTSQEVLGSYMVSPLAMTMEMHMIDVMYAPTDAVTLMAMIPYRRLTMDHTTRMASDFTASASGIGDLGLHGLFSVFGNISRDAYSSTSWGPHRIIVRGGIVLPTGSIDARDDLPMGPSQKLPYPMQVGSGTLSLVPGIVYLGSSGKWAWEVESLATVRLGSNEDGYSLGDRLATSFWAGREVSDRVSASWRFSMTGWSNIDGADGDLNPMMVPTADPTLRAGRRLDVALGLNTYLPSGGPNQGVRIGLEAGLPVRQWLDGPQLGNQFYVLLGMSWTF